MCRNIRQLHNFEPAATSDEVRAAALQYVRKVSGSTKPSAANQAAFDEAVAEVAHATQHLLDHLTTTRAAEGPRDRGRQGQGPRAGALRRRLSPPAPEAPGAATTRATPRLRRRYDALYDAACARRNAPRARLTRVLAVVVTFSAAPFGSDSRMTCFHAEATCWGSEPVT